MQYMMLLERLGRAKAKYFSEGDQEIEIQLIPTHAHRGFPDSFIYRPRRSPGFIGYMETNFLIESMVILIPDSVYQTKP